MKEYDIIIVGGGIAGLSAGIYAVRAGKKVLVLEGAIVGGQINEAKDVENYPGFSAIDGVTLMQNVLAQAEKLGVEIAYGNAEKMELLGGVKTVTTALDTYAAPKIILAMGTGARAAGLKNERELIGSGVSYCATCDGTFFKGSNVTVYGASISDVKYLSALANKVYFVTTLKNLPPFKEKNVEVITNAVPVALNGMPLNSVTLKMQDGTNKEIPSSGFFVSLGSAPNTSMLKGIIELDEKGYILTDEKMRTNINGVYAAGDIRKKDLRQLVTAASDGAIAGKEAAKKSDVKIAAVAEENNEVISAIHSRRSIRSYDKTKKVSRSSLEKIVAAGRAAPTAHNTQSWHFTVITNEEILNGLNESVHSILDEGAKQRIASRMQGEPPSFFYRAPAFIIVSQPHDTIYPAADAACAMQNMMLAAYSLGLGSCWINQLTGKEKSPAIKKLLTKLNYPKQNKIYACLSVGYPQKPPAEKTIKQANNVEFIE